jgi:long-chain acyl-CoA synthetase
MNERPGRAPGRNNLLLYIDRLPAHGERIAYRWREGVRWRSRTFGQVHRRIFGCAARLAAAGIGAGDPVLIQGPDGPDWVEALLATLRIGAVAVPLDVGSAGDFRARVAAKVGGRLLIAPPGMEPPPGMARLDLGAWQAASGGASGGPAAPWLAADPAPVDRAEVMFTSGTTGEPKGVVLTHGNVLSDFAPVQNAYLKRERLVRLAGTVHCVSTLPLSHMFGQAMNVFLPLFMGLTVVVAPARPRDVIEATRRHGAWALFSVPRLLDLLAAEVRRSLRERGRLEAFEARAQRTAAWPFYLQSLAAWPVQRIFGWRFRLIVSGGAALPEPVQQFWERCGTLVVQGYGLTETAPIVSISNPFERRAGSVGRALHGQEVRLGEGGEVLVRGPNVTPGYLGMGQEAFDGDWFRTGDVGTIDEGGRLRIRGRLKDVIVTPEGENVHPIDVEAVFAGLPGVRGVSVIGLPLEGGERVHAVLIFDRGADPEAIVTAANEKLLPRQRVRGHTTWPEDDFPRTATGKVRKALLRDRVAALQGAAAATGASAPAAAGIGGVRRVVAGVARVEPGALKETTKLVEGLGLASLDMVELAVALEEEFGVAVQEDRLATATVGDLERMIREATSPATPLPGGAKMPPAVPPVVEATGAGEAPQSAEAPEMAIRGALRMPRWARLPPVNLARRLLEETAFQAVVHVFGRPTVEGLEHLTGVPPPYLLVANHLAYLDTGLFKTLLPRPLRGRIAAGMTTRYHRGYYGEIPVTRGRYAIEWFQVRLLEFLFNAWPLPESSGVRASLDYAGELADAGYSLLIFPEGRHVLSGRIEPFRKGIGIFARELRLPVVPGYVEGTVQVFPDDAWWPRFGRTRLVLGRPFNVDPDADAGEITRQIETAVRQVAERAARR